MPHEVLVLAVGQMVANELVGFGTRGVGSTPVPAVDGAEYVAYTHSWFDTTTRPLCLHTGALREQEKSNHRKADADDLLRLPGLSHGFRLQSLFRAPQVCARCAG